MYVLDEHTVPTICRLIHESEGSRKTLRYEIGLAMRPMKFEIVHSGSAAGQMRRAISRVGARGRRWGCVQVRRGHERTEWLKGLVEIRLDLLSHIQNRLDSSLSEASPIANVVLGAEPNTGQNLNGPVGVGHCGRAITVLALSAEEMGARIRQGNHGGATLCEDRRVGSARGSVASVWGGEGKGVCGGLGGREGDG